MINLYTMEDEYDKQEDKIGMKIPKIKNKAPATLQITAEQLIKESQSHRTDDMKIPSQILQDEDELNDYKLRKRKGFEDDIKRQRYHIGCWVKYAQWEEHIGEFDRARNVYERAFKIDYRNTTLWLKYAEMEMKNKFINHARNVWERACTTLPRVDQFWYKYAYMEEMLGNYIGAREIFKAWMTYEPGENAWMAFAKFEERVGEIENAREVLYKYIECHTNLGSYMRVAKFEEKHDNVASCRRIYESAVADLGEKALAEEFFINFIKFEIKQKEYERARVLFKFGLDKIPKEKASRLYKFFVKFEKMHGTKETIEEVIYAKRRLFYEKELEKNPMNYDLWFDLTRLEENGGDIEKTREVYERALANLPPFQDKKYWRRYIFLWINYAVFEELTAKNIDRANEVYKKALEIIPHKAFTFSKLWILYAHFFIRNKDLEKARKIFGMSIGLCPREKVFKAYVELELQLGNIDRCRSIYEKFIECQPENTNAWVKYAELEKSLDERDRCRAIFEIAIGQNLDMPEIVWKTYINVEISFAELDGAKDYERVRQLYTRLLEKTKHLKVWLSFAEFEQEVENYLGAREAYEQAYNFFKEMCQVEEETEVNYKEERVLILERWIKFEQTLADNDEKVTALLEKKPKKVKKRRKIKKRTDNEGAPFEVSENNAIDPSGEVDAWEEYYDYIFPDDDNKKKGIKILEFAQKWATETEKEK